MSYLQKMKHLFLWLFLFLSCFYVISAVVPWCFMQNSGIANVSGLVVALVWVVTIQHIIKVVYFKTKGK